MRTIVKHSCPYYKDGTTCNGDVVFEAGFSFGVCQSCKKEVPLILEM